MCGMERHVGLTLVNGAKVRRAQRQAATAARGEPLAVEKLLVGVLRLDGARDLVRVDLGARAREALAGLVRRLADALGKVRALAQARRVRARRTGRDRHALGKGAARCARRMQLSTLALRRHALLVGCGLSRREDVALARHLVKRGIRLTSHLRLVAGHASGSLVLPRCLRARLLPVALLRGLVLLVVRTRAALRLCRLHLSGVRRAAGIQIHAAHLRSELLLLLRMNLLLLLLHLRVHLLRLLLLLLLRHHRPGLTLRPTRLAGRHRRASTELLRHRRHARRRADAAALARRTRREAAGARRRLSRLQRTRAAARRHHAWLPRHARLPGRSHGPALRVRAGAAWPRHALRLRRQAVRRRW